MTTANSIEEQLYQRISSIITAAHGRVARTVNVEAVNTYWHIGREIVLVEQCGTARAGYGDTLVLRMAHRLTRAHGRGYSASTIWRARAFYLAFPGGSAIAEIPSALLTELPAGPTAQRDAPPPRFPAVLGWTHYLILLRVRREEARRFYEIEAARGAWSTRELERQIAALSFERLAAHRTEEEVRALAGGHEVATPRDVIKDPFVLEFLDLADRPAALERDLEQAIIERLEAFMLELGRGFCFVARQKRITIDGDHFYIDLVFYNRLLRAFVIIDLKLGRLTHQDLGQMQMYVNYIDRFQRAEHEERTIGIVLCSEKNDAMVKITLPEDNQQILAARYQTCLPSEEELRRELARERDEAERVLRLSRETGQPVGEEIGGDGS